jgi:hypothetical protein
MKLTIDLPLDVFQALATRAISPHRHTPQQAAYMLTKWVRDGQHGWDERDKPLEPVGVASGEQN